jgi:hypothetical protein
MNVSGVWASEIAAPARSTRREVKANTHLQLLFTPSPPFYDIRFQAESAAGEGPEFIVLGKNGSLDQIPFLLSESKVRS